MKKSRKAFTLVELLIVITIIGVLVGLIMPAITGGQISALKTTSLTFLRSMGTAATMYNEEYGYWPDFLVEKDRVNLNDDDNSEKCLKSLTGKDGNGVNLSPADRKLYNRKGRSFITFNVQNLSQKNAESPWKIVDSFGNPNIYICVDTDGDGFINKGFPTMADGIPSSELSERIPNPDKGVRAKIILFTLKKDGMRPGADYTAEDVFSW